MAKRYLLLDCDGVIFDSNRLIDKEVKKMEFRASDEYGEWLFQMLMDYQSQLLELEDERARNDERVSKLQMAIEEVKKLRSEHFLLKDMVLEEALPEYRRRIDYNAIFQLRNTFDGVIEKIRGICETGIFDEIFIVSHYNSPAEAEAKRRFFAKYLPTVKVILVEFHKDKFTVGDDAKNKSRERTNKITEFLALQEIIDYTLLYFIDDTVSIVDEALSIARDPSVGLLGEGCCLFKRKKEKTVDLLDIIVAKALGNVDIEKKDDDKKKRK